MELEVVQLKLLKPELQKPEYAKTSYWMLMKRDELKCRSAKYYTLKRWAYITSEGVSGRLIKGGAVLYLGGI